MNSATTVSTMEIWIATIVLKCIVLNVVRGTKTEMLKLDCVAGAGQSTTNNLTDNRENTFQSNLTHTILSVEYFNNIRVFFL